MEYSHLVIDNQININTKHANKIGNTNSSLEDDTVLNSISSKFILIIG